jgi:hypothetical protein
MLRAAVCASMAVLLGFALALPAGALGAGDATEAFCPNEGLPGFVAGLPDCRAYEMVSPPFKTGQEVQSAWAVSSDGSRLLTISFGVFAGAESNDNIGGGDYEFVRSASGWAAASVSPPASGFPYSFSAAASSDLSRVLFFVRAAGESVYAEDMYVREPDGSFVEVGPTLPPSLTGGPPAGGYAKAGPFSTKVSYQGASADLSHVLFSLHSVNGGGFPVWPGDTTSQTGAHGDVVGSLYEYVGTANTRPALVGVDGEGRLISDCGTGLGSHAGAGAASGDVYNAVSADGGTVFFTAYAQEIEPCSGPVVDELWARVGGFESVPISEPTPVQCEECDTGAVKAPAVFQGASEDGSKVFFLTEQELFAGDSGMNLYEYDFNGKYGAKIVRVSTGSAEPMVQGVARVSQDGSHVYFVAKGVLSGKNAEGREPVAGGENLYVFERDTTYPAGHVAFVATLAEADQGDWSRDDARPVGATPDGRFLVFESVADLTAGDTSSEGQVFEYDALAERLVRVSTGQAGYASGLANANAHASTIRNQEYSGELGFRPTAATSGLAVSAVGAGSQVLSRVTFESVGALTPGAEEASAAGASSVYEYRSVGSIANGNVYLISQGTNKQNAVLVGSDMSGGDTFFATADPLLTQDVDTNYDLYDARESGGFPAPMAPAGCEGEGCQGAPSVAPVFGVAGSVGAAAGGNLPPAAGPAPVVAPKPKPKPKKPKAKRKHRAAKHKKKGPVKGRGSIVHVKGRG